MPATPVPAEPAAPAQVADSFEAVATPAIREEPREQAPIADQAPPSAAADASASTESPGALETARRRFLGGARSPKESGSSADSGTKADPYAPLSRPEGGPFEDAGF
jgi:hypothetical protein